MLRQHSSVNSEPVSATNYVNYDYNVSIIYDNRAVIGCNLPGTALDGELYNTTTATIEMNYGTVTKNGSPDISDEQNKASYINFNEGKIEYNYGSVVGNNNYMVENHGTLGTNNATLDKNYGTLDTNKATLDKNYGLVGANYGSLYNMPGGTVLVNRGTVYNDGGDVLKVKENYRVYERVYVSGPIGIECINTESGESGLVQNPNGLWLCWGGYDMIITPTGDYELDELDISISFAGNGSATATPDGSYKLLLDDGAMTVRATPKAASLVPATGDNSNMPLCCGLLAVFAALALVTRRKKA